jgi:hypothetical protein
MSNIHIFEPQLENVWSKACSLNSLECSTNINSLNNKDYHMKLITYLVPLNQLGPPHFGDKFSCFLIWQVYAVVEITQPNYSSAEK